MDFYILFYIFLVALASGLVVSSRNPVQSVLFLVLVFFLTAIFFLCLGAEFLALIFLMVYIGAIATLFLFVVMMLNLRLVEAYGNFSNYHPLALFLFLSWLGLFSLLALPALPSYGFSLRG